MRFEAVIFDLDGTPLDSMDVWEKIDICFLQKRRLPVPAENGCFTYFDCTKYSMDAFTGKEQNRANVVFPGMENGCFTYFWIPSMHGKEQNRANVVPMMCQFEDANDCCRCCQQESKL